MEIAAFQERQTDDDDEDARNDDDEGDRNDEDDKQLWVYLAPCSIRILFLVIDLASNVCKLDFRFLLSAILVTKI